MHIDSEDPSAFAVLIRVCIDQIEDVVEEEQDEMAHSSRYASNAEASTSESQVMVLPTVCATATTRV